MKSAESDLYEVSWVKNTCKIFYWSKRQYSNSRLAMETNAVGDPDSDKGGGARSSRPYDKSGGAGLKKIFFSPSGPSLV